MKAKNRICTEHSRVCVLPQATITSLPWPTWQAKKKQLNENCHLGIMVDVLQNKFVLISAKI